MKTTRFISAILLLFSLPYSSCKKSTLADDTSNKIKGIVVDYPSKLPVHGIKVYLKRQGLTMIYNIESYWKVYYYDTLEPPPYYLEDSVITDANGRFSLDIPTNCQGSNCYGAYLPAIIDPNKTTVTPVPIGLIQRSDTIFIDKPCYFKLNMLKHIAATATDTIFETRYFIENGRNFFSNTFRKAQIGKTNVTIIDTFSYTVSSKVRVEWRHYKNGLQASSIDTINLSPNGTTEFTVHY